MRKKEINALEEYAKVNGSETGSKCLLNLVKIVDNYWLVIALVQLVSPIMLLHYYTCIIVRAYFYV